MKITTVLLGSTLIITPLLFSLARKRRRFVKNAFEGDIDTIINLINSKDFNINAKDCHGETALHAAIIKNRPDIVLVLLEKGADVNAMSITGYTPLHYAAEHGQAQVVKMLLQKNANIHLRTMFNKTPLALAIKTNRKEVVELILAHSNEIRDIFDKSKK